MIPLNVLLMLIFLAASLAKTGECAQADQARLDDTSAHLPSPAKLAIWTDKLGYLRAHERIDVFVASDPMGDKSLYREFIYLENIETRQRQYLLWEGARAHLREDIEDVRGNSPRVREGARLARRRPTKIWSQRALESGLFQFVVELRSPDTTEILKRASARFVVSARLPVVLGADGRATDISGDTTWHNDEIREIRQRVNVLAGATLTIEPGTLVLARGPQAAIVIEAGGRILAQGRPDAPIVMTCNAPLGKRFAGCWGGLIVLGRATPEDIVREPGPAYGSGDPTDSSSILSFVRVEFAGAGSSSETRLAGMAFHSVGSGTLIDHVQVHASGGDGILFSGGRANCRYCVVSGSSVSALTWEGRWLGTAQHVFLQSGPEGSGWGIVGEGDGSGFDELPGSAPGLYNLTVVGDTLSDPPRGIHKGGLLLRGGAALTARNVLVLGFEAGALTAADTSASWFMDGTSSMECAIFHAGAGRSGVAHVNGGVEAVVQYVDTDPLLLNARYEANPDPRPMADSPALKIGAAARPPFGAGLDTDAQYIGAFGESNWLEGWTFFGLESDYDTREGGIGGQP